MGLRVLLSVSRCCLQGAALIRMLANVMGQSLFQKGLNVSCVPDVYRAESVSDFPLNNCV